MASTGQGKNKCGDNFEHDLSNVFDLRFAQNILLFDNVSDEIL